MTTEIAKISQFQKIGDDLVVSMTSEVFDIQKDLEKKYPVDSIPIDLSVKKNYDMVKSAIRDIKKPRIALEKDRKSISSVPFNLCKKINAAAKPISESLISLEDAWKSAKTEYDEKIKKEAFEKAQAENARIENVNATIEDIRMTPIANMDKDSKTLSIILSNLDQNEFDKSWLQDEIDRANTIIAETKEKLATLISGKKAQEEIQRQQEEQAAKLAAEQKAAEEKAQAEREEQDRKNKIEADRLEKLKAEQDRIAREAAEKLERERAEFEEEKRVAREKQEAIELAAQEKETARIAAIKKEEEEKEAKLKAEQEKEEAEERAKAEKEAEENKRFAIAENLKARILDAEAGIQLVMKSGDGSPSGIVKAIILGEIPHLKFV